tara:strand:+ start:626 stop:748 length:123 start_codon:yes stop_codon:yes gene_type:complete
MINIKLKNTADTPAGKDPNSYSPTLKNITSFSGVKNLKAI